MEPGRLEESTPCQSNLNRSMMTVNRKLSILVQSDKYFDFVEKLADAAVEKGASVKIHILGDGVSMIQSDIFVRLAKRARISICATSFKRRFKVNIPQVPLSVAVVPSDCIVDLLKWSDRHVVF